MYCYLPSRADSIAPRSDALAGRNLRVFSVRIPAHHEVAQARQYREGLRLGRRRWRVGRRDDACDSDYIIVLRGEIRAILDKGEKLLTQGDILIQRGTNHSLGRAHQGALRDRRGADRRHTGRPPSARKGCAICAKSHILTHFRVVGSAPISPNRGIGRRQCV